MTSSPLDTLIELARKARDTASISLAQGQRDYHHISTQVEQLDSYRQEYRRQLQKLSGEGIELATLREYQRFLSTLDNALESARQALQLNEQKVSQQRAVWQEKQLKLTSYDTLAERRNAQLTQEMNRREQRQHDDLCTNSVARKWISNASNSAQE